MSSKRIRVRELPPERRYECFDCGFEAMVRQRLTYCPNCGVGEQFYQMD